MATNRVLLVDDHPVVLDGLKAVLSLSSDIQVVGEATSGLEAIEKVQSLTPDVVVMDIRMPGMDGIKATREIKAIKPEVSVIIFTMYETQAFIADAMKAGASGFLLKDASKELICHTIRAVQSGGMMFRVGRVREALGNMGIEGEPSDGSKVDEKGFIEHLTPREKEVLTLLVTGQTNKDIGASLGITEITAKKHVQNIIAKMGASSRTEAAVKAMRAGLVQ